MLVVLEHEKRFCEDGYEGGAVVDDPVLLYLYLLLLEAERG